MIIYYICCELNNWFKSPTFFFPFLDGNIRIHVWSRKFNVIVTEVRHCNAVVVAAVDRGGQKSPPVSWKS